MVVDYYGREEMPETYLLNYKKDLNYLKKL